MLKNPQAFRYQNLVPGFQSEYNRKVFALDTYQAGHMLEELFGELRGSGLRMTAFRTQVVKLFLHGGCGLSARQVWERVRPRPHISTVHRSLLSLEVSGFLRKYSSSDGILRYRCSRKYYPDHAHFRCDQCGCTTPVQLSLPGTIISSLEDQHGFRIDGTDITLEGICRSCSRKNI